MRDADAKHIINYLRQATVTWDGRKEVLKAARKRVRIGLTKDGRPKYKLKWQCAKCRKWFLQETMMEVDHIVELGTFDGDWTSYIRRMFPKDKSKLQVLCVSCHQKKTAAFQAAVFRYERKKIRA